MCDDFHLSFQIIELQGNLTPSEQCIKIHLEATPFKKKKVKTSQPHLNGALAKPTSCRVVLESELGQQHVISSYTRGPFQTQNKFPPFFSLSESFIAAPVRNKLGSIGTTAPRQTSTTRTAGRELPFAPHSPLWNCVCCTTVVVFVSAESHLSPPPGWQWQSVVLRRGKELKQRFL